MGSIGPNDLAYGNGGSNDRASLELGAWTTQRFLVVVHGKSNGDAIVGSGLHLFGPPLTSTTTTGQTMAMLAIYVGSLGALIPT